MNTTETWIMDKAREFDQIGDWPQPFEAFQPPGETPSGTTAAVQRLAEQGRLQTLGFEAEGRRVNVVAGLGDAVPHQVKPGPGEPGHHRAPGDHAHTIGH